eukprot:2589097-Pyramimonas_sp.AAC.1
MPRSRQIVSPRLRDRLPRGAVTVTASCLNESWRAVQITVQRSGVSAITAHQLVASAQAQG